MASQQTAAAGYSEQAPTATKSEQVLNEVRAALKKRKLDGTLPSFQKVLQGDRGDTMVLLDADGEEYDEAKLRKNLTVLKKNYMVVLDRTLAARLSNRKRFIRKAVRKLTRFYINPVVRDQNSLNAATANVLHQMNRHIAKQEAKIRRLEKEVESLKKPESGK